MNISPGQSEKWQFVEETARLLFQNIISIMKCVHLFLKHYEVISRSVGDTTDIVSKKCIIFMTKGNVM